MIGSFILSLDTEIAWGTDAPDLPRYAVCFDHYRAIVHRLIATLDNYAIPATWAVVGHLFLAPDDPRAQPPAGRSPDWYHAPDVIAAVRAAGVEHEIGTHTFTHVYAHDPQVTPAVWQAQLEQCVALHREQGLALRSLVFPRNQIAYLALLPGLGISAYRGMEQSWHGGARGAVHLFDRALAVPPPTYDLAALRVNDRLVNLPASQFLLAYDGLRGWIPTASRVRQARRGLERAARRGQLFHLWFHPFNLGTSPRMFDALEQILAEVIRRRERGELQVWTMGALAAEILAS